MTIEDHTDIFKNHIREHVFQYFPGLEPGYTLVELLKKQERATALIYQFSVSNQVQSHTVFVKVLHRNSPNKEANHERYEKPLLYPKTDLEERHRLQHSALTSIYDYFTSLDKKQLGAIRVLDCLPHHCAILTEGSSEPSLRQLLLKKNHLYALHNSKGLLSAFQNVGAWLRMYHTMPKNEDVNIRHSCRDDYLEAIDKLIDFLVKTLGQEKFFRENALTIKNKAIEILPVLLPLGLGHGDFALRNIFIGENARATVFDTFAKWRTPVYEDIGYFLNDLKVSSHHVLSQGLLFRPDQIKAYENSFLAGYFEGRPIPCAEICLYEILALLDKWSSLIAKSFHKRGFRKGIGRLKMILINRYLTRRWKVLLAELHGI